MQDFVFSLLKTLTYWAIGAFYILVLMAGSWLWNRVFGGGDLTVAQMFFSAAVVFVPIIVGKVISTKDE